MRINIEDYLHAIDLTFKGKEQKEIFMTYVMLIASIFAFAYLLFWDNSLEEFKRTHETVKNLKQKIAEDKMFLQINPESKISQLSQEIQGINNQIILTKDNNAYIKSKIETISSLIYDERTWGEYLDSISKNAQRYGMKIESFTNKYALTNNSFGHILDITIKSSGSYKNTLLFINSLEQSDLVVDVHNLDIKAGDNLTTNLNISVWGITY